MLVFRKEWVPRRSATCHAASLRCRCASLRACQACSRACPHLRQQLLRLGRLARQALRQYDCQQVWLLCTQRALDDGRVGAGRA